MTACAIGYYTEDNTIRAVVCETEGFIDGVGFALLKQYSKDWDKVEELVENGNLTVLDEDYLERTGDTSVNEYDEETEFLKDAVDMGCEYVYLFAEDDEISKFPIWHVARPDTHFVPIVDRMLTEEEGYVTGVA